MNEELLYNELYERTKAFDRNNFIKELMRLERENKQLKEQLQQRDEVIEKAITYLQGCYEMSVYTKSVTFRKRKCR